MSGLIKPKKYSWQNSNLEYFGSKTEIELKKQAAMFEKCWDGILDMNCDKVMVWRIEQFKVVPWPQKDYGKFFNGDSYIILKITNVIDCLSYDIHFWIGKYSSQDEYGTAAYKTVELDNYLNDKARQHREVQGNESQQFQSYFDVFSILKGGTSSGFRHVTINEASKKLTKVTVSKDEKGHDKFHCNEIKMKRSNLEHTGTYILETNNELILWVGKNNSRNTWFRLMPLLKLLETERNGHVKTRVVQENQEESENDPFYDYFDESDLPPSTTNDYENREQIKSMNGSNSNIINVRLFKLSDVGGSLKYSLISENSMISKEQLTENDVYIIDSGKKLFVYIGTNSSKNEKQNALSYAHNYLRTTQNPLVSVTCLNIHTSSCTEFQALF